MSKPFNIHDWQDKQKQQRLNPDKQKQQRLNEQRPPQQKAPRNEPGRFSPGADVPFGGGDTIADQPLNADDLERLIQFRDNLDDMMRDAGYSEAWILKIKTILRGIIDSNVNEASMTGTGTSITTGDSMAYATPKAFKKKRKED